MPHDSSLSLLTIRVARGKNFESSFSSLRLEAHLGRETKSAGPYYGPNPSIDEIFTFRVPDLKNLEVFFSFCPFPLSSPP